MGRLLELFHYLKPHRRGVAAAAATLLVYSLLLLSLPWLVREIVDAVFQSRDGMRLHTHCLTLLGLLPLFGGILYLQNYLVCHLNNRLIADLRLAVYHHLLELPLSFYGRHRLGEIISRVTADITVIQESMMFATLDLLRQTVLLGGGVCLMLAIHWRLALLALLGAPALALLFRAFNRRLRDQATTVQDRSADLSTIIEETMAGVRDVKSHAREEHEQRRFTTATEVRFDAIMTQNRTRSGFIALAAMATLALLIGLLWYGGHEVIAGRMTPGDLVAVPLYLGVALGPVAESTRKYAGLQEAIGASRRVYEILGTNPESAQASHDEGGEIGGDVVFANVSFRYPDTAAPTLVDVNLHITAGEHVALVGRSGAGKTTLIHLLPRFHEATAGEIRVDGRPGGGFSLPALRRQVGLVAQDTFLFGGSIADNLRYARPGASDAELVAAATAASAHAFIAALPQGYETLVGDRGMKLSTGQRQRLAIARMFLKNPRIVLLDEATSALDAEAEAAVNAALAELTRGRTTFTITQNISATRNADRIIVLDAGRIAETGTFAELIAQNGIFRKLHDASERG